MAARMAPSEQRDLASHDGPEAWHWEQLRGEHVWKSRH